MNNIFITGASGNLGRHLSVELKKRKDFKVVILKRKNNTFRDIKWNLQNTDIDWPEPELKSSYWLIHLAYDWYDRALTKNNKNYNGSIALFDSFCKKFHGGKIIFLSTTVSSEENRSSYSQTKTELTKWINMNNQIILKCGIFVDYPVFGQFNFINFLSSLPIAIIPLKNKFVQLSSREAVKDTVIKIIKSNSRIDNNISCLSAPLTLNSLHKKIAALKGNDNMLVINLPYYLALIFMFVGNMVLKKLRLLEKLNGLKFNKEMQNNLLDDESIDNSIQMNLIKIKHRLYILEANLFFKSFVRTQNYFVTMRFYIGALKRVGARNFFIINLISLIPGKTLKFACYLLLSPLLQRPYIHSYLRSKK